MNYVDGVVGLSTEISELRVVLLCFGPLSVLWLVAVALAALAPSAVSGYFAKNLALLYYVI